MKKLSRELSEKEFQYVRLLDSLAEKKRYTMPEMAEQIHDKERNARRCLEDMVGKGYIMPRTYQITEKGRRIYRRHFRWWQSVYWFVSTWGINGDEAANMADRLFFSTSDQLLQHIQDQCFMEQIMRHDPDKTETIEHTDFFGQIRSGMYREGICLWELDEKVGYFRQPSPAAKWFLPEAELVIKLKTSRLALHWSSEEVTLLDVAYETYGSERIKESKGGRLELPIDAFTFIWNPRYRMLEGSLDIRLHVLEPGGDGSVEKREYRAKLELPMIARHFCEHEGEEQEV